MPKPPQLPVSMWTYYIGVDDIDRAADADQGRRRTGPQRPDGNPRRRISRSTRSTRRARRSASSARASRPRTMAKTVAILIARLIFAGDVRHGGGVQVRVHRHGRDGGRRSPGAGFPFPLLLAWVAAFFEVGAGDRLPDRAVLHAKPRSSAIAYVLFLGFSFHGPDKLEQQPDGVRVLRRSLHLHRRAAVRRRPWPGQHARSCDATAIKRRRET